MCKLFLINILIFIIIISSCNSNSLIKNANIITKNDFQYENLQAENIVLDSVWEPMRIYCQDTILFLVEKSGDFFVHSYNLNNNNFLSYNVPSGIGPNESTACWEMRFINNQVILSDPTAKSIKHYNFEDFVAKSEILPLQNLIFESTPIRFAKTKNNDFVVLNLEDSNNNFNVYDSLGKKYDIKIDLPNGIRGDFDNKLKFRHKIDYNLKQDKIVVYYDNIDLLDIYDSKFKLLNRIWGPYCYFPEIINQHISSDSHYAFENGCLTDDYIYLLFSGLTEKEDNESEEYYNTIMVFDYLGNPYKIFNLDVPIFSLAVDSKNNCIYGLADNPERCIVKYKLE